VLAGPYLQLANGLVDYETDRAAGLRTLPVVLGPRISVVGMAVLLATIHGLAWLTLASTAAPAAQILTAVATAMAVSGLLLSARQNRRSREAGWMLQAASIAVLGGSWLLAAAT
jgi:4-hydroxybenzoate polyprenyltransferase